MIITFVGHSSMQVSHDLLRKIQKTIIENTDSGETVTFYCGGYGDFDIHCASVCRSLKSHIPQCEVVFVTPYFTPSQQAKLKNYVDTGLYDSTLYPPIEETPPRFARSKRNEWMISKADLVIAYVSHTYGGAYQTLQFARRKKKRVINLAE